MAHARGAADVRRYCVTREVGKGTTVTNNSSKPLANGKGVSALYTSLNIPWWLVHMIRIVAKLVTNVRYDGHRLNSALPNVDTEIPPASRRGTGTVKLNTSNVIATAKTPSLKDSRRPVCFSTAAAFGSLLILSSSPLPLTLGTKPVGPGSGPASQ